MIQLLKVMSSFFVGKLHFYLNNKAPGFTGLTLLKNFDMKLMSLCFEQVSNLQYEMLLLTDSISKEGGCWELRLRCGKPDFFTSSIQKMVYFLRVSAFHGESD